MEIKLKGKIIFINGLTGAIGRILALKCLSLGAEVYGFYGRNEPEAKELRKQGVKAEAINLAKEKITSDKLKKFFSPKNVYGLVNAAGLTIDKPLMYLKEEEWDEVINVNLSSVFYLTRAMLPLMVKGGRIINLASSAGLTGSRGQTNYASAKAGLWGFTKSLAREAAKDRIMVNMVLPGFIPSKMTALASSSVWNKAGEESLFGEILSPQVAADFIVYLLSDYSHGLTGQAFNIDNRIRRWW